MADRVAVMLGGEILQIASPREVYERPADLRVARFIGSPRINELPATAGVDGRVSLCGQPLPLRIAARGPSPSPYGQSSCGWWPTVCRRGCCTRVPG
jgi:multiple sugar transport system ATP-binding protein